MFTIARNRTYRYLNNGRSETRQNKEILVEQEEQRVFEQERETDISLLPEELLESKEKQKMIVYIIDSLPTEQKKIIYLRYYNGLSVNEIADQLNISDGTVKSRLNYGRKKIEAEVKALEKKIIYFFTYNFVK